jgi:hypothetical protein
MSIRHSSGVYFPGQTPHHHHHSLATVELSGLPFPSLSLCLVKEGFSLGKLKKSSKPITVGWQAI